MQMSELEARYRDKVSYSRIFRQLGYARALENPFYQRISGNTAKILDCGCGAGNDVRHFSVIGFDAIGIDINPFNIKLGFDFYDDHQTAKRFVVSDCCVMPFEDETFAYANSGSLIHCFSGHEQIEMYLRETRRVLEKNGTLIGRTHGAEQRISAGRRFFVSEQELIEHFDRTGFGDVEIEKRRFNVVASSEETQNPDYVLYFFAKRPLY